jgi:hypothetical protein
LKMRPVIRIRIRYSRRSILVVLLALAVLVVQWSSYSAWGEKEVAALAPLSPARMRQYYLSRSYVQGDRALSVCADGYHFASIWEIADPSNLKYNTALGLVSDDSGQGPPTAIKFLGNPTPALGWVRTGYSVSALGTTGQANCNAWTTQGSLASGTVAGLPTDWAGGQDIGAWEAETRGCSILTNVWCVQDVRFDVFLPLVMR